MNCLKCSFDLGRRARGGACKKCGFEFAVRRGTYLTPGLGILWDAFSRAVHEEIPADVSHAKVDRLRELLRSPATLMAPLEARITASPDQVNSIERAVAKQVGDALSDCDLWTTYHSIAYGSAAIGLSRVDLMVRWHRRELLQWKETLVVSHVKVLACPWSCPACAALHGRRYTVDEAMASSPLPCPGCSNLEGDEHSVPFCRCVYTPVVDRGD